MRKIVFFLPLIAGLIGILVGIYMLIMHYNRETAQFLIKAGLLSEAVFFVRLIVYRKTILS
jgi:hypothetical protein